ncbi:MAG TPA: hypothetical protein PKJ97_01265 [Candidatus Bilamarchaeaceae archaeon]|nr:hypothetical protein [Candidatus Bilamarchaeaceae archaeon]
MMNRILIPGLFVVNPAMRTSAFRIFAIRIVLGPLLPSGIIAGTHEELMETAPAARTGEALDRNSVQVCVDVPVIVMLGSAQHIKDADAGMHIRAPKLIGMAHTGIISAHSMVVKAAIGVGLAAA